MADAPISDVAAADAADGTAFDADEVRDLCERAQAVLETDVDLMRDWDRGPVYEDETRIVWLEPGYVWGDVADEIAPGEDRDVRGVLVASHDAQFRRDRGKWHWTDRDITDALGASDAVLVAKPDPDDEFGSGDDALDAEWTIAYGQDRRAPFNFNAVATLELAGDHGTLRVERTYRALPDHNSAEPRDEAVASTTLRHVESDDLLDDHTDRFSVPRVVDATTDQFDAGLRQWVRNHHLADPEAEYQVVAETVLLCQECDAYPEPDAGIHVEQRPTRQFGGDAADVVCNHCYAAFLADATLLSDQEAQVYALRESGLSYSDIANAIDGVSRSQVGSVMGRVERKVETAGEQRMVADRTLELVAVGDE